MFTCVQFIGLFCAVMVVFSINAFGCSCAGVTPKSVDELRRERRNYFLNEFPGAAFIGRIVKRQRVKVKWIANTSDGEATNYQMYRYTIGVKEYWLGVKSHTVIVYGEPAEQIYGRFSSGNSCGFKLTVGKTLFFTPYLYQNNLRIGQCDFAGGGSDPGEGAATEFRKILGEPKRF